MRSRRRKLALRKPDKIGEKSRNTSNPSGYELARPIVRLVSIGRSILRRVLSVFRKRKSQLPGQE